MKRLGRPVLPALALASLLESIWWAAPGTQAASTTLAALLLRSPVAIHAACYPELTLCYERVVFEFVGPVHWSRCDMSINWSTMPQDHRPSPHPILQLTMRQPQAYNDQVRTAAPPRVRFNLRWVNEVASSGDVEALLSYGIDLAGKSEIRVTTRDQPSRVAIALFNA